MKYRNLYKLLVVFISITISACETKTNNQITQTTNPVTIEQNKQINTYINHINRIKFQYNGNLSDIKVESFTENNIEQLVAKYSEILKNESKIDISINDFSDFKIISTGSQNDKAFLIGKYPEPYQYILSQPILSSLFVISSTKSILEKIKNSINFKFSDMEYLQEIIEIIKDNSISKGRIDFNNWEKQVLDEFSKTKNLNETIKFAIKNLNDNHSSLWSREYAQAITKGNDKDIGLDFFQTENNKYTIFIVFPNSPAEKVGLKVGDIIENNKKNTDSSVTLDIYRPVEERRFQVNIVPDNFDTNLIPEIKTIKDNVLYIELTGATGNYATEKFQNLIHNEINKIDLSKIKSIILDLRRNTGGYTFAMLNAVGPILGNNQFGGRINSKDEKKLWTYKEGQIFYNEQPVIKLDTKPYNLPDNNLPVCILVSNMTASAGEAIAVAFKGREKTIFIGEKTNGKSTGNNTFIIYDKSWLNITDSVNIDRNGQEYFDAVLPDIFLTTEWQYYKDIEKDRVLIKALNEIKP